MIESESLESIGAWRSRRALDLSKFMEELRDACRRHHFGIESTDVINIMDRRGPRNGKPFATIGVDEFNITLGDQG